MTNGNHKDLVSAKEISKKFGVTYPTLNHYTNLGFFNVVSKRGNKRFYQAGEVREKLALISKLKDDGYPLRLIRKKLIG
ncbi:MAG: MerR family transcriptional regulator [Candidatus Omnitrophica bacterium]|nr:MerR family transcriptional regulator [Candidatus Omnitrophota bacterium]